MRFEDKSYYLILPIGTVTKILNAPTVAGRAIWPGEYLPSSRTMLVTGEILNKAGSESSIVGEGICLVCGKHTLKLLLTCIEFESGRFAAQFNCIDCAQKVITTNCVHANV